MPESINALWRNASPLKRLLLAGVPALVIPLGAIGVIYAGFSGGDSTSKQDVVSATQPAATATSAPATATPAPKPTETPVSAGLQATAGGGDAPSSGGQADANTDGGADVPRYQAPAAPLSGPGPIEGTSWSLSIPAIGVNASVYSRTIGEDGQMGDPSGPFQVIWYDFAANGWTGLGGAPGQPGANAVMAGHVDYIHVGPAVFWSIRDLQPGDIVTVNTDTGPINYSVQWSQWAEPDQDFTGFVTQTGQESITLVTCIGSFSAGHYSNRFIVRAVRV
jgi:LPXTG-site transpeptidase (sortase) family protein